MIKKYLCFLFLVLSLTPTAFAQRIKHPMDNMPLVPPVPLTGDNDLYGMPIEERGEEYKKFLSPSLKIMVSGASGSGTIIYYDKKENLAYVATCGHLWNPGVLNYEQAKIKKLKCKVLTWFHNDKKLDETKTYEASVLFYSYVEGCDTALIKFTPDWIPDYFPIAPKDYPYIKGSMAHSMGCDGGNEVAHYKVEIVGIRNRGDLVTIQNSPRPGRSGGGLVDDNFFYIGTCWGTTAFDGGGQGFFTSLPVIHDFWSKNSFDWLLKIKKQKIIVLDRNTNKKEIIEGDYILMPSL
jgi:hypothetical protein